MVYFNYNVVKQKRRVVLLLSMKHCDEKKMFGSVIQVLLIRNIERNNCMYEHFIKVADIFIIL